jgi:ankyrin repeat protein
MPMPNKINPDECNQNNLFILNKFRASLQGIIGGYTLVALSYRDSLPPLVRAALDGIKVVDCLRFVKVNEHFIRYAFANKNEWAIYVYKEDKAKGVLRDFHDTSFHLNGYDNIEKCIADLHNSIDQFEKAIRTCEHHGKLDAFIKEIEYDENVGCLATRILNPLLFAKKLETQSIALDFKNLMSELQQKLQNESDDGAAYKIAFDFFRPHYGKQVILGHLETRLDWDPVIDNMINILSYDLPPSLSHVRSASNALQVIKAHQALAKTLSFPLENASEFNFIVTQLRNSSLNQASFSKTNSETGEGIGLLFDSNQLDAGTKVSKVKSEWWSDSSQQLLGARKEALIAVFATKNDLFSRLNALKAQCVINNSLGLELPIVIHAEDGNPIKYNVFWQRDDVEAATKDHNMRGLLNAFGMDIPRIISVIQSKQQLPELALHDSFRFALLNRDIKLAIQLINLGADANYMHTLLEGSMLWLAIQNDLTEVIKTILNSSPLQPETLKEVIFKLLNENNNIHLPLIEHISQKYKAIDVNTKCNQEQNYALHLAIIHRKPKEIIQCLCQLGAYIFQTNNEGKSPLLIAIETGQFDLVDILLNTPTQNHVASNHLNAIFDALISSEHHDLALRLLEAYPKQTPFLTKNTLLLNALTRKDAAYAQALIPLGAEVNGTAPGQRTLFLYAFAQGMYETVEYMWKYALPATQLQVILNLLNEEDATHLPLLERVLLSSAGINWNSSCIPETQNYALHLAIIKQKPIAIIRVLNQAGADCTKVNRAGKTPLLLAIELEQWELVPMFIDNPAMSQFPKAQLIPTYEALLARNQTTLALALLKQNNSIELLDTKNHLLFKALINHDSPCALELLNLQADPHHVQRPETEISLLWLAIEQDMDAVVTQMLGMRLKQEFLEKTILFLLNSNIKLDLIAPLLNKGTTLNLNAKCVPNTLNSSLHEAIIHNASHEVIALLCKKGANITSLNRDNKSPLDLALELEHFDLVRTMLKNTSVTFTKEQAQQVQRTIGNCTDAYLMLDLKFKIKTDALAQRSYSVFKKPIITAPEANSPLSWQQFKYLLRRFNKHEGDLIYKVIDKHVGRLDIGQATRNLINNHAKACCNYLRENKRLAHGIHQRRATKTFLERILCSNLSHNEIEHEALNYIRGTDHYKLKHRIRNSGSGHDKHSRIAYAYDMGLFKAPETERRLSKFSTLSKEERKQITETVKRVGMSA